MLNQIIKIKKDQWLQSPDCTVIDLIKYIRGKGQLRDTQTEAIETYLFLKIKGQNKPLWQLFSEGFFTNGTDLAKLNINQAAREFLSANKNAFALYDFTRQKNGTNALLPELEKRIVSDPAALDYDSIIKGIFYNVHYPDYLMSLPMGAGKTFLMAAFMYLDLYFAANEPDNKAFAHNFLVLIPSGLKSSIVPSLKTIENFDPSWVLPQPAADKLKRLLKFEVLDEQKSGKKSNKARNPNAQKVNACLPNPFGQVFVVNAEKVILESFKFNAQTELQFSDEEKDTTNDLKRLFGEIPNLSLFIDEVHHAATDDVKLRQAVNYWQSKGNITTVLGFSGTPYLQSSETVKADHYAFKFSQITNTVYYYPLVTAIKNFLKTPTVKIGQNMDRFQIIKNGIKDFDALYKGKTYKNGTIPKIAIYCSNIAVLEEEVYPYLTAELKINPEEILKYHGGNKFYTLPKENELEFRSLDLPLSKKRYILLVQVGKEGWDCRSLTGVILSQKGDSPQNMVLQTSCRCLRQVDKEDKGETALIWLNQDNANTLNKQLKLEQNSSIEELNNARRKTDIETVTRHSRMEYLNLPKVAFYQMKVTYQAIDEEDTPNTEAKLNALVSRLSDNKAPALISTSEINNIDTGTLDVIDESGIAFANYNQWLFEISRESFGLVTENELHRHDTQLCEIFDTVTYKSKGQRLFNELYDLYTIQSKIRLAYSIKRDLQTETETIPKQAELLIASKLTATEKNPKLCPNEVNTAKILELDASNAPIDFDLDEVTHAYKTAKEALEAQGMANFVPTFESYQSQFDFSWEVKAKNQTFHYLPYNFGGSGSSSFEMEAMQKALQLSVFKDKGLEIYYNGERGLTEFVINCYAKEGRYWKNIGKYTTDFLILKRTEKASIHKALLIETKGAVFAGDDIFQKKKKFVETEFLKLNQEKFGYQRFDFLYLEDSKDVPANIAKLNTKINRFFND